MIRLEIRAEAHLLPGSMERRTDRETLESKEMFGQKNTPLRGETGRGEERILKSLVFAPHGGPSLSHQRRNV